MLWTVVLRVWAVSRPNPSSLATWQQGSCTSARQCSRSVTTAPTALTALTALTAKALSPTLLLH
jgi:hypothetical protein